MNHLYSKQVYQPIFNTLAPFVRSFIANAVEIFKQAKALEIEISVIKSNEQLLKQINNPLPDPDKIHLQKLELQLNQVRFFRHVPFFLSLSLLPTSSLVISPSSSLFHPSPP